MRERERLERRPSGPRRRPTPSLLSVIKRLRVCYLRFATLTCADNSRSVGESLTALRHLLSSVRPGAFVWHRTLSIYDGRRSATSDG